MYSRFQSTCHRIAGVGCSCYDASALCCQSELIRSSSWCLLHHLSIGTQTRCWKRGRSFGHQNRLSIDSQTRRWPIVVVTTNVCRSTRKVSAHQEQANCSGTRIVIDSQTRRAEGSVDRLVDRNVCRSTRKVSAHQEQANCSGTRIVCQLIRRPGAGRLFGHHKRLSIDTQSQCASRAGQLFGHQNRYRFADPARGRIGRSFGRQKRLSIDAQSQCASGAGQLFGHQNRLSIDSQTRRWPIVWSPQTSVDRHAKSVRIKSRPTVWSPEVIVGQLTRRPGARKDRSIVWSTEMSVNRRAE